MTEGSAERPVVEPTRRAAALERSGLPDTSPTWELELLLSGAVLVALFQLSGVFDRAFDRVSPHLTGGLGVPIFTAYAYGKAVVLALAATFVLHLASRGYWVGLVGLHSVFPRGVQWDQLKYGPITREVFRERLPSLPRIIARLDNFCSALFSFGFLLAFGFALSLVFVVVSALAAYLVTLVFFGGRGMAVALYVMLSLIFVGLTIFTVFDRRVSPKLDPSGRPASRFRRVARGYYWASAMPIYGPIGLTLLSNTRRRVFTSVMNVATIVIFAVVVGRVAAQRTGLEVNTYAYFAQAEGHTVNPNHYESLRRSDTAYPVTVTIQSDLIREPFVKLFVPYVPGRHNRAIPATCPGVPPLRSLGLEVSGPEGEDAVPDRAAGAVLACFARLHPVRLNGSPVADLEYRFYTHPHNSLRGVVAYIPTASLPRGRNVLTVQGVPPRDGGRQRRAPPAPHVIPFWL